MSTSIFESFNSAPTTKPTMNKPAAGTFKKFDSGTATKEEAAACMAWNYYLSRVGKELEVAGCYLLYKDALSLALREAQHVGLQGYSYEAAVSAVSDVAIKLQGKVLPPDEANALFRISVRNALISERRKLSTETRGGDMQHMGLDAEIAGRPLADLLPASSTADGPLQQQLQAAYVAQLLQKLPKNWARMFNLYQHGYKYEEISERCNIPLNSVRSGISRAKARLAAMLENS